MTTDGRRDRPEGFTLIELLVVLAIAGLALSLSVAGIAAVTDRFTSPMGRLEELLSEARTLSARRSEPIRVRFLERGGIQLIATDSQTILRERSLPEVEVQPVPVTVTYFPTGTATTSRFCLRNDGEWITLAIDPVTGRAERVQCRGCCLG